MEDSQTVVWTGKLSRQSCIPSKNVDLDALVKGCLRRVQLKSFILLHQSNPDISVRSLVLFLLLHEHDHLEESILKSHGLLPALPVSPRDEAKMAFRDREELEIEVLDIIHAR
jgi:hypothetical protein